MDEKTEVLMDLEWMESTLAAVLVEALPKITANEQEAFAVSAAKAVRNSYKALVAGLQKVTA